MIIEDNVAYDTGGHCFMLEDGIEKGNQFIRNLGAHTKLPRRKIPNLGTNGIETDDQPATFWIAALENSWVDNVAAGCDRSGFGWWFEPVLRGPLARNFPNLKIEKVNIVKFENNVAHSNGIVSWPWRRVSCAPLGRSQHVFFSRLHHSIFDRA